jgi:hypothetical protein
VLVLVSGYGVENVWWATQIGMVCSACFGIAALCELSRENPSGWRIATLLTLAVASHGVGVAFLVAGGSFAILSRQWSAARWIVIPCAILALWSLALQLGELSRQTPIAWPSATTIGAFIFEGTAASVAAPFGLRPVLGYILVVIGALALARLGKPTSPALVVAGAAAIATEFALVALVRGYLGPNETSAQRYLYVSVPLILVLIGGWLGRRTVPRPADQRIRFALVSLVIALLVLGNVRSIILGRVEAGKWSDRTQAIAYLAERIDWLPAVSILRAPPPKQLLSVINESGRLDQDQILGISFGPPPREAIAWACEQFFETAVSDPLHTADDCVAAAATKLD